MTQIIEFIARDDGTALDSKSGLTWCRFLLGQAWQKRIAVGDPLELPLSEVMAKIDEFNAQKFGSFSDWRLPTQAELSAVFVGDKKIESNDHSLFGENESVFAYSPVPCSALWTFSAHLAQEKTVELVVGYYGGKEARTKFTSKYARLVRG